MPSLVIALAQVMTVVGDLEGNHRKIIEYCRLAEDAGADIVAFPELSLTGYPPQDLLLTPEFANASMEKMKEIAASSGEIISVVGYVERDFETYNSAAVLNRGALRCTYRKALLPNYGVFDEKRYFGEGDRAVVLNIGGTRLGLSICEDIWYPGSPVESEVSRGGAQIILNISASPFNRGKHAQRRRLVASRAVDGPVVVAYVNAVGAQDELVFDGGSCVYHPSKGLIAEAERFVEELLICEVEVGYLECARMLEPRFRYGSGTGRHFVEVCHVVPPGKIAGVSPGASFKGKPDDLPECEEMRKALTLGLREFASRNGFEKVVLGLSGGVDSALTAALAVEAVGSRNTICVFMPSGLTSEESGKAAETVAKNSGARLIVTPIGPVFEAYLEALKPYISPDETGVALENIQARIRGTLLMGLSNLFGWLVLATGNKSELSMGYCTLYGDMAGGYALLKDVLKTDVYAICRHINCTAGREVIPREVIERPPTAELRPDQLDTDSLPPYGELDWVLEAYVEQGIGFNELLNGGFPRELVESVTSAVGASEHKRRQAPIGPRITPRAFGRDWRMPVSTGRSRKRE